MSSNQQFLQNLYDAFNKRDLETIISLMRPDGRKMGEQVQRRFRLWTRCGARILDESI